MMERKTDLGQTFGTKKAKKAIRDNVLNAIAPQKKAGDNSPTKIDNASRAMLNSVGAITSKMATREELQAAVDDAKPIPRANLEAEDIQDVYDPAAIIGADILNLSYPGMAGKGSTQRRHSDPITIRRRASQRHCDRR